jgi:tetratricopeptide (TPR) repeat protein
VAVCLSVALGAGASAAQSTNRVAAEALFREARKLLDEGKYKEACEKLSASQDLDPAVGTLLNLGRCYEKTGQKATAWETYREAITAAKQSGQSDREKTARRAADALEPTLPQLTIVVPQEARVTGLAVTRDGVALLPELWGVTVPVDPGEHTVAASAPGKKSWSTTVSAEERANESVTVASLETDETAQTRPDAPLATAPQATTTSASLTATGDTGVASSEQPSYWNTQRTLAVVFGAVGVAGGAVAIVEALDFSDKKKAYAAVCNGPCASKTALDRATSLRNDAQTASTIGIVSGAIGGASLIAGVVLWFTAGNKSTSAGSVHVIPVATTDTLGVAMNGTW